MTIPYTPYIPTAREEAAELVESMTQIMLALITAQTLSTSVTANDAMTLRPATLALQNMLLGQAAQLRRVTPETAQAQ